MIIELSILFVAFLLAFAMDRLLTYFFNRIKRKRFVETYSPSTEDVRKYEELMRHRSTPFGAEAVDPAKNEITKYTIRVDSAEEMSHLMVSGKIDFSSLGFSRSELDKLEYPTRINIENGEFVQFGLIPYRINMTFDEWKSGNI